MKYLFLSCFILSINFASAQAKDIRFAWGDLSKSSEVSLRSFAGVDANYFYGIGYSSKSFLATLSNSSLNVRKFDKENLKLVWNAEIEPFDYKGHSTRYIKSWINEGSTHLLFNTYDRKTDQLTILTRNISATGKISSIQEVFTTNSKRYSLVDMQVEFSQDSTYILIFTDETEEKGEEENFTIRVFNRALEPVWSENFSLPYTGKYFSLEQKTVTNTGEVFLVGYSTPDKTKDEKKQRDAPNKDYKLYRFTKNTEEIDEFDLNLDDKYISQIKLKCDFGTDIMALAGFYSEKSEGRKGGSLYLTINQKSLKLITKNTQEFSKEFLLNFMTERRQKRGNEIGSLTFKDFIRREDGGALIIAEPNYEVTTTIQNANGGVTTTTTYYSMQIVVIKVDKRGAIQWSSVVDKSQSSGGGFFYLSYALIDDNEKLSFIFLDNPKNPKRIAQGKRLKNMSSVGKSIATIATVDEDGVVVKDVLFSNRKSQALLVPSLCMQISESTLLMYGIKKSNVRFGKLIVD